MGTLTDAKPDGVSVSVPTSAQSALRMTVRRRRLTLLLVLTAAMLSVPVLARYANMAPLKDRNSQIVELAPAIRALAAGRPVIVLYVSPTCPHCHAELARLATNPAFHSLSAGKARIVLVAPNASMTMRELLPDLDVVALDDSDGAIRRSLGVLSVPARLLFDQHGRLVGKQVGETSEIATSQQLESFAEVADK